MCPNIRCNVFWKNFLGTKRPLAGWQLGPLGIKPAYWDGVNWQTRWTLLPSRECPYLSHSALCVCFLFFFFTFNCWNLNRFSATQKRPFYCVFFVHALHSYFVFLLLHCILSLLGQNIWYIWKLQPQRIQEIQEGW